MTELPLLVGMEEEEALRLLRDASIECRIKRYSAPRPLENADSRRVVRVTEHEDALELLICEFRTHLSQG